MDTISECEDAKLQDIDNDTLVANRKPLTTNRRLMRDDALLKALRELGECLSAVDVPHGVVATFPSLSNLGPKLFVTVLEQNSAALPGATDCIMRLEPSDLLLECLLAARAHEWPRFIVLVHEAHSKELSDLPEGLDA